MTLKKFQKIKILFTVGLAILFSQALILKNFILPVIVLIVSILILWYLRSQVREVVADERDYETSGKAARIAIQIYAWLAVILMFFFYAQQDLNPAYEAIAITLAYSTCFLMILYTLIFRYYHKLSFSDKKIFYLITIILMIIVLAIFGLRLFSGEDDWICQNGQWVKHGQPDFPAPTKPCR